MVRDVILPKLGQTMEEGTIVEWLKEEGDPIDRGEVLFTVESDKATLEVEAPTRGFLRKILVPAGASAPVLTPVGLITREPDEDISGYEAEGAPPSVEAEEAEPAAPDEPEGSRAEAEQVERERIFASPRARKLAREEGVALVDVQGTGPNGRIVERDVEGYLRQRPEATPVARRLAEREGIDLQAVEASGPGGRVVKADVERALAAQEEPIPTEARPALVEARGEVPIRGVRARIASRMHASHQVTAPVTLTTEVDATAFVELRERLKVSLADELGFNLGYNDLLIKLVAHALRDFPTVNARLERDPSQDLTGRTIRHLERVHVGLAVDTERGLLVPVVRDADEKNLKEIARSVRELIESAQSGSATPDDLSGSTFTITNLGMYDIDAFTPIINLPEVAILGVGRIKPEPSVVDGEIAIRQKLWLSLTFDHRLVDGAPAARFLRRVKQLVEEPYLLLA
jgi:pyruvate dehydrogenase E2 component (dihydrolipoamide acetyltransferase)